MRFGVDFGTTTTTVATVDRGNYPVVSFEDGFGDVFDSIPSVIAYDEDGLHFGFEADRRARAGAQHLRSFKRLLADPQVTSTTTVRLGNRDFLLLELVTLYLRYVATALRHSSSVATLDDSEPLEAAIGVPAHAWSGQRFLTLEAFRDAGWTVRSMINEPSAAGFEYTHRHAGTLNSKRTCVLVYDLGGGTFDASIVAATGTDHQILGTRGDNLLGGDDFDLVLAHCIAQAGDTDSGHLGEAAWSALIDECKTAKEALTPNSRIVSVPLGERIISIPVQTFYEAATPLVESTLASMLPLLVNDESGAKLGDDIAGLYVVGGGAQLPLIARILRDHHGRRVHRSQMPTASTAIGLAIGIDPDAGFTMRDQLSRGLGVFREKESGALVSFDTLLEPDFAVDSVKGATITRRYRAAHNIGYFRFAEYSHLDDSGVPRGDVLPFGEVLFPFDRSLQVPEIELGAYPIDRCADSPLIEERYSVDSHGIVSVQITDIESGYSIKKNLGSA
ncbi:Hsp70 family protein [Schaalia vaccimaxillae]|uniref:Hsp70 family protein n=1 Tax=Schaalia vaccimaxillae TaxID=183916 RepID=UPI0003B763F5|nr:Hsp70 family protein [Schaalia vaccimaxillae]